MAMPPSQTIQLMEKRVSPQIPVLNMTLAHCKSEGDGTAQAGYPLKTESLAVKNEALVKEELPKEEYVEEPDEDWTRMGHTETKITSFSRAICDCATQVNVTAPATSGTCNFKAENSPTFSVATYDKGRNNEPFNVTSLWLTVGIPRSSQPSVDNSVLSEAHHEPKESTTEEAEALKCSTSQVTPNILYSDQLVNRRQKNPGRNCSESTTTMVKAPQPASMAKAGQPANMGKAAQPASKVKAAQPASMVTAAQPASMATAAQPASMATAAQPASMVKTAQPASMVKAAQPASKVKAAQPASKVMAAQPASKVKAALPASKGTVVKESVGGEALVSVSDSIVVGGGDGLQLDPIQLQVFPIAASVDIPPSGSLLVLYKLPDWCTKYFDHLPFSIHVPWEQSLTSLVAEKQTCKRIGSLVAVKLRNLDEGLRVGRLDKNQALTVSVMMASLTDSLASVAPQSLTASLLISALIKPAALQLLEFCIIPDESSADFAAVNIPDQLIQGKLWIQKQVRPVLKNGRFLVSLSNKLQSHTFLSGGTMITVNVRSRKIETNCVPISQLDSRPSRLANVTGSKRPTDSSPTLVSQVALNRLSSKSVSSYGRSGGPANLNSSVNLALGGPASLHSSASLAVGLPASLDSSANSAVGRPASLHSSANLAVRGPASLHSSANPAVGRPASLHSSANLAVGGPASLDISANLTMRLPASLDSSANLAVEWPASLDSSANVAVGWPARLDSSANLAVGGSASLNSSANLAVKVPTSQARNDHRTENIVGNPICKTIKQQSMYDREHQQKINQTFNSGSRRDDRKTILPIETSALVPCSKNRASSCGLPLGLKAVPFQSFQLPPYSTAHVPLRIDKKTSFDLSSYKPSATIPKQAFGNNIVFPEQIADFDAITGLMFPQAMNIGSRPAEVFQLRSILVMVSPCGAAVTSSGPTKADLALSEKSLYVGNLPAGCCTVEALRWLIDPIYPVSSVDMKKSFTSHQLFAHVQLESPVTLGEILNHMNSFGGNHFIVCPWKSSISSSSADGGSCKALQNQLVQPEAQLSLPPVSLEGNQVSNAVYTETDVWIGGLPFPQEHAQAVMQSLVYQVLEAFGTVKRVAIRNNRGGEGCHAIVSFASKEMAKAVIEQKSIRIRDVTNQQDLLLPVKACGIYKDINVALTSSSSPEGSQVRKVDNTVIWIGGLPLLKEQARAEMQTVLGQLLEKSFGSLTSVEIRVNKDGQKSCYAVACFANVEAARAAIDQKSVLLTDPYNQQDFLLPVKACFCRDNVNFVKISSSSIEPSQPRHVETEIWIGGLPLLRGHALAEMQTLLGQTLDESFGSLASVEIRANRDGQSCHAIACFASKEAVTAAVAQQTVCLTDPQHQQQFMLPVKACILGHKDDILPSASEEGSPVGKLIGSDIWLGGLPLLLEPARTVMQMIIGQALEESFGYLTSVEIRANKDGQSCHAIALFANVEAARAAVEQKSIRILDPYFQQELVLPIAARKGTNSENRLAVAEPMADAAAQLWVGNLPPVSEKVRADLMGIFRKFGAIRDVVLQYRVQRSFQPYFFAYITFDKEESVEAALKAEPIYFYRTHLLKVERRRAHNSQAQEIGKEYLYFSFQFCFVLYSTSRFRQCALVRNFVNIFPWIRTLLKVGYV